LVTPKTNFDPYTLHARIWPSIIVVLPLLLGLIVWIGPNDIVWGAINLAVSSSAAWVLFAQLGRDKGRKKQTNLFKRWNGSPTLLMLRHRDSNFEQPTLRRYHDRLSFRTGLAAPSVADENTDQGKADAVYESWTRHLLEHTRDNELVLAENMNYGFRRNLWGMKPIGITLSVAGLIACILRLLIDPSPATAPVAVANLLITLILTGWWVSGVTPDWVKVTADAYAKRLIGCCETLPSQPSAPSQVT
jgi:hypothetical protein